MTQITQTYKEGSGDVGMTTPMAEFGRVSKSHPHVELMGQIDWLRFRSVELLGWLEDVGGMLEFYDEATEEVKPRFYQLKRVAEYLQANNFVLGAFAYWMNVPSKAKEWHFDEHLLVWLEEQVGIIKEQNHNFLLLHAPGSCASAIDSLRLTVRDTERALWKAVDELSKDQPNIEKRLIQYPGSINFAVLNRLADYLYFYYIWRLAQYNGSNQQEWSMTKVPEFHPVGD
jgi:cob(I)alamin adenosyltransferase